MNYTTAIFLISDKVKMHAVTFAPDDRTVDAKARRYHFKTFDDDLQIGQYVVVPSSLKDKRDHGMSVAQIQELDVEVDFDSGHEYKWIIGCVHPEDFENIKLQEEEAIAAIRKAEKTRRKKELRQDLMDDAGDELKKTPHLRHKERRVKTLCTSHLQFRPHALALEER